MLAEGQSRTRWVAADTPHVVLQAEQAVQEEAERRVSSIGSDRSRWPPPAREEVVRLEKKQQVKQ